VHITGETVLTPELYWAALLVVSRRTFLAMYFLGVCFALLGVLSLLPGGAQEPVVGVGLLVFGALFGVYVPIRSFALSKRRAAPILNQVWRYEVSERSLRIAHPLATTDWHWKALTRFDEYPDFWLVRTPFSSQAILVIKAAFAEADRPAVAELARRLVRPASA
jgi:hypothetical protein